MASIDVLFSARDREGYTAPTPDPLFSQVQRSWKRRTCTEMRHAWGRAGYCGAAEVVPETARVSALAGHWASVGFWYLG
ncbi:hypothetical protein GOBAR_DD05545 [Gossypium barbadense]|nr:hypothetical protein GOBAR_DD05545 [Gossypium barbadense]